MSNIYFKNFPDTNYILPNGKSVVIKDIFRKVSIQPEVIDNIVDYTWYEIQDGERPDVVATRLYGDSKLYWLFYLVNELDNYNDWFKSNDEFFTFINEKYPGYWLNAPTVSDIITTSNKFLLGERVTSLSSVGNVIDVDPNFKRIAVDRGDWSAGDVITGKTSGKSFTVSSVVAQRDGVEHYKNSDGLKTNVATDGFLPVTAFDIELEENERKRKIKVIRKGFVPAIIHQFSDLMTS